MQRDANYKIVGFFTLVVVIFLGIFIFWLGKYGVDGEKYYDYQTQFSQSVAGLKRSSPVKFKGIEVGFVETIRLDEKDPNLVDVSFKVDKTIPIKSDTYVLLTSQGIAGMGYLELKGGTPTFPLCGSSHERVHLPSDISPLSKIVDKTDLILEKTGSILSKVEKMTSDENINHFSKTLHNFSRSSQQLHEQTIPELTRTLKNGQGAIEETKKTAGEARELIEETRYHTKSLMVQSQMFMDHLKESPRDLLFKSAKINPGPGEE